MTKGATVGGHYEDFDKQYPVMSHTIAKAGDPQANGATQNGQLQLVKGTNSTPIGPRNANNAFITRKGRNIKTDDNLPPQQYPEESNDSEGKDIANTAVQSTKYSQIPTIGSILNPVGSVLQQIAKVDPQFLNSVLPNAVTAFTKIKDLNAFSATGNVTNILGQTLGMVLNQASSAIGASTVLNALGNGIIPSELTSIAQQALGTALITSQNPPPVSDTVASVMSAAQEGLYEALIGLLASGQITTTIFNTLMALYFESIQAQGTSATLGAGVTPANILNVLGSVLPTIAGAINGSLDQHLPASVLNTGTVQSAIQKFAMGQAFLKAPSNGKKALAIEATTQGASTMNAQISSAISGVQGVSSSALKALTSLF